MLSELGKATRKLIAVISGSTRRFCDHDGVEYSGYISFLLTLGIFPFLIIVFASFGIIIHFLAAFLAKQTGLDIVSVLAKRDFWYNTLFGSTLGTLLQGVEMRIKEIVVIPEERFFTIAAIGALWSASSLLDALKIIVKKAYGIHSHEAYLRRRFNSIVECILASVFVAFLLLLFRIGPSLMVFIKSSYERNAFRIPRFFQSSEQWLSDNNLTTLLLDFFRSDSDQTFINAIMSTLGSILMIAALLLLFYNFLLSSKLPLLQHAIGALACAIGFEVASYLLLYYIKSFSQLNFIYGSLSGLAITMFYFYLCSMIFIFCAEINGEIIYLRKQSDSI